MGDSHGSARASDTTATAPVTEAISRIGGGASTSVGPSPAAASPSPSINAFQAVVATWDRTDVFDADGDASSVSPPPTRVTTAPAAASSPSSALDAVASAHATPEIGAPGTRRPDSKRTPAPAGSST